jgi:hypothetical protein
MNDNKCTYYNFHEKFNICINDKKWILNYE